MRPTPSGRPPRGFPGLEGSWDGAPGAERTRARRETNPIPRPTEPERTPLVHFRAASCGTGADRPGADQYWSALTTSPPAIVPRARQVTPLIVFLMNRTLPSANRVFTPPAWKLLAESDM